MQYALSSYDNADSVGKVSSRNEVCCPSQLIAYTTLPTLHLQPTLPALFFKRQWLFCRRRQFALGIYFAVIIMCVYIAKFAIIGPVTLWCSG